MFTGKILGKFAERLESRIAAYQGQSRVAARIDTPPELAWWYWVEFGTATRGDAGRASGEYYEIDPVEAEALRFPHNGAMVIRDHVDHPGIRPHRSVTRVLPEIHEATQDKVRQAFQNGASDNPSRLQEAVISATKGAKALIVGSMAETLGRRDIEPERGKLGGKTAAEVFDELATVVNLSGEA